MSPNMLLGMVTDCALIAVGLESAIFARLSDVRSFTTYNAGPDVLLRFALVILVCVISLYFDDLYDFRLTRSETLVRMLRAFFVVWLALSGIYYLDPSLSLGRGIATMALPLALMLTLVWRLQHFPMRPPRPTLRLPF